MLTARLKVLLVDDAVVVRRVLAELLGKDASLEVVGAACNGRDGLDKLKLKPDVVVLDVEMPEMDGIEMLQEMRRRRLRLPVVMFSSVTQRAAEMTLRALSQGASDYVAKPTARGSTLDSVLPELVSKIKLHGAAARRAKDRGAQVKLAQSTPLVLRRPPLQRPKVVVIAASTGGPIALSSLLARLPARLPVPAVVVQHMPDSVFTEALTESLAKLASLPVSHAKTGTKLGPGGIWVAPGGSHLALERAKLDGSVYARLTQDPPVNGVRPAADVLFSTAAQVYGAGVLGIVLTGMGQDGLRGAQTIISAGGSVVVQDEATSVVWGMPGAVARAGLASAILPLPELGAEVSKRFGYTNTEAPQVALRASAAKVRGPQR